MKVTHTTTYISIFSTVSGVSFSKSPVRDINVSSSRYNIVPIAEVNDDGSANTGVLENSSPKPSESPSSSIEGNVIDEKILPTGEVAKA
jgi:hypothetical protein